MNMTVLKDELLNDPLGRGYSSMSDLEVIQSLLEVNRSVLTSILSDDLLAWAGMNGRFVKITRVEEDETKSDELRSVAWAARTMVERDGTDLDLNLPDREAMLDLLVSEGVIDSSDKDDLVSLASRQVSRAEELGLGFRFQQDDIQKARP